MFQLIELEKQYFNSEKQLHENFNCLWCDNSSVTVSKIISKNFQVQVSIFIGAWFDKRYYSFS
jgi:transcription elongation factor Elf1